MRSFFLFVALAGLLAAVGPARAQSGGTAVAHGKIVWGGYAEVPSRAVRKQKVPVYQGAQLGLDDQVGWFSLRVDASVQQGQLANLVYEPFSAADARLYTAGKLPAGPEVRLVTGLEMKRVISYVTLRPVRLSPQTGQPERLVSFDYNYLIDNAPTAARGMAGVRSHADHSVLRTGDWYKMGVAPSETGNKDVIYKLDKATLAKMGLTQTVNPNNLHIYGNGTGILPQPNATWRPDDLVENHIMFVDNNRDNVLDDNEYFLFYSPGAHTWEKQGEMFKHRSNIYTDTAYYFVTVNSTPGLRVPTAPALTASSATPTVTTFTYRDFYEHDLLNLMHSGRNWVGEGFRVGGQKDIKFSNISDLVAGSPVRVVTSLVAGSATPSNFQLTLNNTPLGTQDMDERYPGDFSALFSVGLTNSSYVIVPSSTVVRQVTPSSLGTELTVGITYNSPDGNASGYLDFVDINAERLIKLSGSQLSFRKATPVVPTGTVNYVVNSAPAGMVVWDVTNPRHPVARPLVNSAFVAPADTLREFVALQPSGTFATPRPFSKAKLPNQDLHALNQNPNSLIDLLIVTHPAFYAQAVRLGNYRTTHDNLRVAVVTTSQVYNEYGSGGQDVTAIRDLMKQLYDLAPAGRQMQLLLFGDASFDYKSDVYNDQAFEPDWFKKERTPFKNDADFDAFNQNYVPTYESRESLSPFVGGGGAFGQSTYSSDDYYVLLDDNEGEWNELIPGTELLDAGVGRLPVRMDKGEKTNAEQARQVVDKIIGYDATASYGKWRNRITLVADDGNGNLFVDNTLGSDKMAGIIQNTAPVYNVHKVYLDLYPQLSVAAGQRSPEASHAIDQSVEQGSLIVHYLGHGGPKGWTDEQILTNASVQAMHNPNNLAFFVTGTCDFAAYDNPDFLSAGEQLLTDNTAGGAIGLFTTVRVVEAGSNSQLMQYYFPRVLQPLNGQMPNIGTVVVKTKNDFPGGGINNRSYTLLADPTMTLAYPKQTVVLDSIRRRVNKAWAVADTIQALARIRLKGHLTNNGALNSSFTGRAQVTIYDKPTSVMTLGNEPADTPIPISVQESVVYGGQANVVNGQFSVEFVVPKDINYKTDLGKISMYAYDASHAVDANGYQQMRVGGAARNFPVDNTPPDIKLFMDSESFVFGGLTAQTTTLLAQLSDSSGINTTGAGIGHDITAVLDHDPNKIVVLNDSYVSSVGDFRSGRVNNLFKDLATGPHSLTLKAWDTYNNSAEKDIEFVVAQNEKLALSHVLNYPNPFANSTTFLFDHNQAGGEADNLDVQVQIFTVAGHLVRTLSAVVSNSESHQKSITWNGRDDFDGQLARGVYVYRLSVRSQLHGTVASKYEKLVILN
ncbi:type IX secretion system sortase PorU [Hymenobacter rubidus]|uniref:type IX secretion system sortase PorU n=1 Tax=Hymenobacter rubidus TaxID=1441626 RepID=UPI00191EEE7E|nr:type IX secretion system sortase PorU [Hymenobacter rubidus]